MSLADIAENAAEGVVGKAKDTIGDQTDDHSLEAEGKKDQTTSDGQQAGENVKNSFQS